MAKTGIGDGPLKTVKTQGGALGVVTCQTPGCGRDVKLMKRRDGWIMRNCSVKSGGCGTRIDNTSIVSLSPAIDLLETHDPVLVAEASTIVDCRNAIDKALKLPPPEPPKKETFYNPGKAVKKTDDKGLKPVEMETKKKDELEGI